MAEKLRQIRETVNELVRLLDSTDLDDLTSPPESQEDSQLGILPYRVIHFENNPFRLTLDEDERLHESLKKENDRLRARLSLIESGNHADLTMRIDEAVNIAHQIETLEQKIHEYKQRWDKISSALRGAAEEIRLACLLLLGYRIDVLEPNVYRFTHKDALGDDDRLFFEVKDGSVILRQNAYSKRCSGLLAGRMDPKDTYPLLLATIVLQRYESDMNTTNLVDLSMSLSNSSMSDFGRN